MSTENLVDRSYPGSRWWKFDFHTHTPASLDTTPWQQAIGTANAVTPEKWLLQYMAAGIDCVVITDHNSGMWIDCLKSTYSKMKALGDQGSSPEGFRPLTLFPGVEISVSGGFHLLAIFAPSAATQDITSLLGTVRYDGKPGGCDAATREGPSDVVQRVIDAGAIPIPAHADTENGLLQTKVGNLQCAREPSTVSQVLNVPDLLAIEWVGMDTQLPTQSVERSERLVRVLGSDCHNFRGDNIPGSRFTWVKMSEPTLEGLRFALVDGQGVSVRLSVEEQGDPNRTPASFIRRIEIDSARLMGNGAPETVALSPYCNALIGGRGTGKSTIVHALRLSFGRDEELRRAGEMSEAYRQFDTFSSPVRGGRQGNGALRDETVIRVETVRAGVVNRLVWSQSTRGVVVEEPAAANGEWVRADSQAVTSERFPIRLFSQGQIAALAGEGRHELLSVIDEAADVGDLQRAFDEAKRTYMAQRARLRELDGLLKDRPEVDRQTEELTRALAVLEKSRHAEVLKAHRRMSRQRLEIKTTLEQLDAVPDRIRELAQDISLDDWPDDAFDPVADQDALAWKAEADALLGKVGEYLTKGSLRVRDRVVSLGNSRTLGTWRERGDRNDAEHASLQATLAAQGVADPEAFGRLVRQRQDLQTRLESLVKIQAERDSLHARSETQWSCTRDARKAVTQARKVFLQQVLESNDFVKMDVAGYGFDPRPIERSLRELIDVTDERFSKDINPSGRDEPPEGLVGQLVAVCQDDDRLEAVKRRLITTDDAFDVRFRNHLQRRLESPGFEDEVRCWFPDDDLHVRYSRKGDGADWIPIDQGSQGQRSAALLAFLLSFGNEPLVLDQPEDDLDNALIYELIVRQILCRRQSRQLIVATHNANVVVNGDAAMVHVFDFLGGQCRVASKGALQESDVREAVCRVMEGGSTAFEQRWQRIGQRT